MNERNDMIGTAKPGPAPTELREERCETCKHCVPITPELSQCHEEPPRAIVLVNPDYNRSEAKRQAKAVTEFVKNPTVSPAPATVPQQPILALFPYPWPQMHMKYDFCGSWEKGPVLQVVTRLPN